MKYENIFKEYLGVKYAYSFWKGRVALYAILKALGIGEGDEVILQGFTCIVVPNAIIYCGARPVYVDIDPHTYNVDINKIEEKISPRTKAIIVQHTFGLPVQIEPVIDIVKKYGLRIIEDCAPALGATYKGKKVGTFGDAAFFSFQWSKVISTGLGGIAVTNNPDIAKGIEKFREDCIYPSKRELATLALQLRLYAWMYNPTLHWIGLKIHRLLSNLGIFIGSSSNCELRNEIKPDGYEKLFSEVQARVGLKEFSRLDKYNQHRRYIAALYDTHLRENNLPIAYPDKTNESIYLRYPLLVKNKEVIIKIAQLKNIEIGDWFTSVLHPLKPPLNIAYYRNGECPIGERTARHIINLPTHSRMDEKKVLKVVRFLKKMQDKV